MFTNGNSVADSAELAALVIPNNIAVGTRVFNLDVGDDFIYTLSDAALDPDVVVEVAGITGARWIVASSAGVVVTTDATLTGDGSGGDPLSVVSAPNADHATLADTATLATTATAATGPANAATFTAALNNATTSLPGLMTAAQLVKLADLDYDGWFKTQVDLMHAQAPALTNFREIKLGDRPNGITLGSVANDPSLVGGGLTHTGGQKLAIANSIFQTPASTSWAMAWRCKMPVPSGTDFYFAGLLNADASDYCGFASYHGGDATHWVLYLYNNPTETMVATSNVADTNMHDFVMTFDGTTVKLYIDTTLRASTPTLTALADQAMFPCINGNNAGDVKAVRFAYGYIAP